MTQESNSRIAQAAVNPLADTHIIPSPKLVCIDIQPYGSSQASERADILNVGGLSDAVFNVVASQLSGDAARFVAEIEAIEL